MFVSRRDELVLKRLRSGEARDTEIARLHGAARRGDRASSWLLVAVPSRRPLGFGLPVNPILLVVGLLLASAAFAAFASGRPRGRGTPRRRS